VIDAPTDVADRLLLVDRVIADPPLVHPSAPKGVYGTDRDCYRFLAKHVQQGHRTLETGAGISSALFAAWGCEHLTIVPSEGEVAVIISYLDRVGIDRGKVRFDTNPSERVLPQLVDAGVEYDLVLIDGGHGFPIPIIDWFYGAGLLRQGGVVVVDDVQLPQVKVLVTMMLDRDDRWKCLARNGKWVAYQRLSSGSLAEEWTKQPFIRVPLINKGKVALSAGLTRLRARREQPEQAES
jgi:hypothetical protein